jgi:hypothetical protein
MRVLAGALIVLMLVVAVAPAADACLGCVALGLASFAVFNQLVWALSAPRPVYAPAAYYAPPPYYSPYPYAPPTYYAPPPVSSAPSPYPVQASAAPAYRAPYAAAAPVQPAAVASSPGRVVQYPHGRYELRGDGVRVAYVWVWIPATTGQPTTASVPRAVAAASQ